MSCSWNNDSSKGSSRCQITRNALGPNDVTEMIQIFMLGRAYIIIAQKHAQKQVWHYWQFSSAVSCAVMTSFRRPRTAGSMKTHHLKTRKQLESNNIDDLLTPKCKNVNEIRLCCCITLFRLRFNLNLRMISRNIIFALQFWFPVVGRERSKPFLHCP